MKQQGNKDGTSQIKAWDWILKKPSNNLKIVSLQICILSPREDDYNLLISASKTNYIIVIKNPGPSAQQ